MENPLPVPVGTRVVEPWNFPTSNVRTMVGEAFETARRASPGHEGVREWELAAAINDLRHAADELERSMLEMKFNVRRTH